MTQRIVDNLLQLLRREGIPYIFGNPGSTEVPLLDALVDTAGPEYLLTLHEGIAMAMADGWAMAARRPCVVSVHATPGVANLLGGMFLASAHRSPVVVLAGQQDSRLLDRRPFLASDLVSAASPYSKAAFQARSPGEVLPLFEKALRLANSPPKGPVLLSVPRDYYDSPQPGSGPTTPPGAVGQTPHESSDWLERASEIITGGERLLLMSGNEVGAIGAEAVRAVTHLAEVTGAMAHSEHNAINMHFPSNHPQYVGGNAHGIEALRPWLAEADVVLAIGCDLFMEDTWLDEPLIPYRVRLVQLNEEVAELGRLVTPDVAAGGDLVQLVSKLTKHIAQSMSDEDRQKATSRRVKAMERRRTMDEERKSLLKAHYASTPTHMSRIYTDLRSVMSPDDIMVDEAVNMASYLHHYFPFTRPDTFYSSKQSWLGWGWGAAMGVQLARPKSKVVLCIGDGSASYALQGLWTAQRYQIPIKTLILNNQRYMAVANHLQGYDGRAATTGRYPGTDLSGIDFVALSRGFGVHGRRVENSKELLAEMSWLMNGNDPRVLEIMIDPHDPGYGRRPMRFASDTS